MLELIIAALMQSTSMKTDSGICHITTQQTNIHQVCLDETGVATIEYKDGKVEQSTAPELVEFLGNI
jgi:hypothetical protein